MKTVTNISIVSAGYGHNKITIYLNDGNQYWATTNNTILIDRIKGTTPGEDPDADEARRELIDYVLTCHGVEWNEIEQVETRFGIEWDIK